MKMYDEVLSQEHESARRHLCKEDLKTEENYNLGYNDTFVNEIINVTDPDLICLEDNENFAKYYQCTLTDTYKKMKTKNGEDDSEFLKKGNSGQRLKILMVGAESSGKTYFLRNHFCNKNIRENIWEKTLPTCSLEIHKMSYIVNSNETISLEILDTNSVILNSSLIKTYLKLCNAFILVCDTSKPSSITFLEMQLEKIINWGTFPKNVYLVINQTNSAVSLTIEWEMYLWNLIEKFRINKPRIQLMKEINDLRINKFFSKCLKRRSISKK